MKKTSKSSADTVGNKSVILNGKKLAGVQSCSLEMDINKWTTLVHITIMVKKDSLRLVDNTVSFDTV